MSTGPVRSVAAAAAVAAAGRRRCLKRLGLVGAAAATAGFTLRAAATPLAKVRDRGALVVGLYNDMPPFHVAGRGIDVGLAQALADALQVKLSALPFNADENMNDDLRNMVWRGHYLGFGPADVLLHVPVDKPLMDATPQATIFGPYYRERVAIARNVQKLPRLDSLADLGRTPVAVPGQTLAGWLMIGADSGAYRDQLRTQLKDGAEAARLLLQGEVDVAAGMASELQAVLHGDARFVVEPLPSPRAPKNGWAVGMAVKRDAVDLAQALQRSVGEMAQDGRMARLFAAAGVDWRPV